MQWWSQQCYKHRDSRNKMHQWEPIPKRELYLLSPKYLWDLYALSNNHKKESFLQILTSELEMLLPRQYRTLIIGSLISLTNKFSLFTYWSEPQTIYQKNILALRFVYYYFKSTLFSRASQSNKEELFFQKSCCSQCWFTAYTLSAN